MRCLYSGRLSARKRRNRLLVCFCDGWWFPHRRGSRASGDVLRRTGSYGCLAFVFALGLFFVSPAGADATNGKKYTTGTYQGMTVPGQPHATKESLMSAWSPLVDTFYGACTVTNPTFLTGPPLQMRVTLANCGNAGVLVFQTYAESDCAGSDFDSGGPCQPIPCDPELAPHKVARNGTGAIPTAVCVSNCRFSPSGVSVYLPTSDTWASGFTNTEENCTGSEGSASGTGNTEQCVEGSVGFEVCTNPTGEGQCGYVNDEFVCIKQIKPGGCKVFGDSSRLCESSAGVPPAPDSGAAGVPATPDDTLQASDSGGTTDYDFYNSGTVAGSSRDPGADGTPQGGSGGGVASGDAAGSSSSGGGTCSAAPSCSGDPIQCAQLQQEWLARCPAAPTSGEVSDAIGTQDAPESEEEDLSSALSETGAIPLGSGVCPQDEEITVMGSTITLAFWPMACSAAEQLRPFILAVAWLVALFIMFI